MDFLTYVILALIAIGAVVSVGWTVATVILVAIDMWRFRMVCKHNYKVVDVDVVTGVIKSKCTLCNKEKTTIV